MNLGLNERGGALAMVAVTMVVLLAVAALAVDLSSAFAARAEAQRIADSAALAGGSAFMEYFDVNVAEPYAEERAYEYALLNNVRGVAVDSSMVTVQVVKADRLVRVWIQKTGLPSWFARIIGFDQIDVNARAAAQASQAGAAKCLKPFAIPDLWIEKGPPDGNGQDANGNGIWDEGEEWVLDPTVDDYIPFNGDTTQYSTGYGSLIRGGDYGRQLTLKVSDPQDEEALNPGLFYPWRLPTDPEQAECGNKEGSGGKDQDQGGAVYRKNICECNNSEIELNHPYDLEPGNMIGPTQQGVKELIAEDAGATWNDFTKTIDGSSFADPFDSPRVIKVALFDLSQIVKPGMQSIEFNNFALVFLEGGGTGINDPVVGRFLWFADGSGAGPTAGSLVYYLRLVE